MKQIAIVLLSLFPVSALAQSADPATEFSHPANVPEKSDIKSSALAVQCTFSTTKPGDIDGQTVLSVHILKDGTITNASVISSSGNTDLDNAAVACTKTNRLPQKSAGQYVEIDWQATVRWKQNSPTYLWVPGITPCSYRFYPAHAIRTGETGAVVFSYVYDVNGNATGMKILQSSGYPDLDDAALNCAQDWHYPPAMQNGVPIPIDKEYGIAFKQHW